MKTSTISLLSFSLLILYNFSWAYDDDHSTEGFVHCLTLQTQNPNSILNVTHTRRDDLYSPVLNLTIHNLRFASPSTPKPLVIITPLYEYQVQPIINCSRENALQVRVRSGGHDYEGLSYTSKVPFVVIDLINFKAVDVDIASQTTWVQSGTTVEELYTKIAEKSQTLGFPAGVCTSVGMGGFLSGGGYGAMLRKYGIAADHVIDARLVDVNGRILDRNSMGEDLFWAIRGGGGGSFGVVLAWKVKLVPVPQHVTVFTVQKTEEQNATQLIHRWEYVAHKFDEDLFLRIVIAKVNSTVQAQFSALFLGGVDRLLPLMQEGFPELGLVEEDYIEMSWIESTIYHAAIIEQSKKYFKAKSDYVKEPIPIEAIEDMWRLLLEPEAATPSLLLVPYGGKMEEISESDLPFPHRAGNLFKFHYEIYWDEEEGQETSQTHINWMRKLYDYMTPFVSKNPREAYVNYRDLDLGINNDVGNTSYQEATFWGFKYFMNNFHRLAQVKTMVDPSNFFRHEQSIPIIVEDNIQYL